MLMVCKILIKQCIMAAKVNFIPQIDPQMATVGAICSRISPSIDTRWLGKVRGAMQDRPRRWG
jgi:hypothetical protein